MTIEVGDYAAAVRQGDSWSLFPVTTPESDKYAVSVKAGETQVAFRAFAPEVDRYALAIRQGDGWALTGSKTGEENEDDPPPGECPGRNPLCQHIPCPVRIYKGYTVLITGFSGYDIPNIQFNCEWSQNCAWEATTAGFRFYLVHPYASPSVWMTYGYRLSDNAVFSNGTQYNDFWPIGNIQDPVYMDSRLRTGGAATHGITVVTKGYGESYGTRVY